MPFTTGNSVVRGGAMSAGGLISTVTSRWSLSSVGGLDRGFVAAVDQDHAFAVEAHERDVGGRLGGRRDQRRHLRPGRLRVLRPAGGLADVDEADVGAFVGDLREQRRFLRAGDGERPSRRGGFSEGLELQPAELMRGHHLARHGRRASPRARRAAWCRRRSRSGRCEGLRPLRVPSAMPSGGDLSLLSYKYSKQKSHPSGTLLNASWRPRRPSICRRRSAS